MTDQLKQLRNLLDRRDVLSTEMASAISRRDWVAFDRLAEERTELEQRIIKMEVQRG